LTRHTLVLLGFLVTVGTPLSAQTVSPETPPPDVPVGEWTPGPHGRDPGELRVGLSLGGTGFIALAAEFRRSGWGGELVLGTITFREVSVALSGKAYIGSERFQPAVGAGIWAMRAWTDDGAGAILLARFPVAIDLRVTGAHSLGLEVAMNRGLLVQRLDPEDDTPVNRSFIPLPGAYYRYGWTP
jgi:hypothetical protein